jgi:heme-degrading monooxygenase HmoA
VIHVIYRHKVAPGTEPAFPPAWEQCKVKMLEHARGLEGATLFRSAQDPSEFVWVTRWTSIEDWKAYWGEGVPDPEGDLLKNDILVEITTLPAITNDAGS